MIAKPILIGVTTGVVVGGVFLTISFLTSFGICPDTTIAETLFPAAVLVDPTLIDRPLLAFVLATLQYPAYGASLGWAWTRQRKYGFAFTLCLVLLVACHVATVNRAHDRVSDMWEHRLSNLY
jgi:hypothetical protein